MSQLFKKLNNLSKFWIGIILVVIFIISILPRLSNLNRPLSVHHEWLTSTAVRNMQIWHEGGINKYNFNQIMTFDNQSDKNIIEYSGLILDKKGDSYYVSYPPFGIIFPFLTFKVLNIYPNILSLQIFNIVLHFISALFIFLILQLLTNKNNLASLAGFILYIFSPITLWFQSNVYMSDTAVQPFFIIGLYLFLKITQSEKIKTKYLYLFGLVNFLMVYTEWLGTFFSFIVFVSCLFDLKNKKNQLILLTVVTSSVAALSLTLFQYSKIIPPEDLFSYLNHRYLLRSGASSHISNAPGWAKDYNLFLTSSWKTVANHYKNGALYLIGIIIILLPWVIKKEGLKNITNNKSFWYLCILPALLHHLIFFNWTAIHDLSVLKSMPFLSLSAAYLISKLTYNKKNIIIVFMLVLLVANFSTLNYVKANSYFQSHYKVVGQVINNQAKADEVVFMTLNFIEPQFMVYAKRNIAIYQNKQKALDLIKLNKAKRGIVFVFDDRKKAIVNIYYIEP